MSMYGSFQRFRERSAALKLAPARAQSPRQAARAQAFSARLHLCDGPSLRRSAPFLGLAPGRRRKALAMALANLSLAGCSGGVLDPAGPIGAAAGKIMIDAFGAMLVIVAPTLVGALAFAWWFRASNRKARYLPDWAFSGRVEIVNWGIPLLVVLFLSGIIWIGSHELDPYRPIPSSDKPLEVEVVSLDWKWLFVYPSQSVASVNALVVPVELPVHFSLTSATVMNSFFVPQLGGMIAVMPGMVTQLYLKADHKGEYHGLSTQLSGDGFSGMHFVVRAVSRAEFDSWIAQARGSACRLNRSGYIGLLRESRNVRPFAYRSVAPGLFVRIVAGEISPTKAESDAALSPEACPEKAQ
jgi:cytochrome o ubiquinol oxidase subunit II